jgi:hypothetical protein
MNTRLLTIQTSYEGSVSSSRYRCRLAITEIDEIAASDKELATRAVADGKTTEKLRKRVVLVRRTYDASYLGTSREFHMQIRARDSPPYCTAATAGI